MNEILSAIKTRRSVKKYKSDMPKREDIEAILNAGLQAPSGRNQQGVIIVAITNKEIRDRYARRLRYAYPDADTAFDAACNALKEII